MIPNLAVVGIQTPHWRTPRLWLPVFLLWIPVILLSPLIFLALVASAVFAKTSIWRLISMVWALLSGLPGTEVYVRAGGNQILVHIL